MTKNEFSEFIKKIEKGEIKDINVLVSKIKEIAKENNNDYDLGELIRESFLK